MKYRYREMVYRPDYYNFNTDDRTEWFSNGIYNYNVSRMISDLAKYELDPNGSYRMFNEALKLEIQVQKAIDRIGNLGNLHDEHVEAADLNRPIIFAEVAPDVYNLIDGHHRLAKAKHTGIETLQAYFIPAFIAVMFLGSEEEYCDYVKYWNSKVEERQDSSFVYCNVPQAATPLLERDLDPDHVWNRMAATLNACRRVELYHCNGDWFTLFRLNGKLFCGEAEAHTSVKCTTPFATTKDSIMEAIRYFEDWNSTTPDLKSQKERRTLIRKIIRHADMLMTCIRVFSEY